MNSFESNDLLQTLTRRRFFSRPFGTCVPCGMFPGVKTPGYSQDVPPGQRNLAAAFCAKQKTRFIRHAFKGISQPRCPAMSHSRSNPAIRISGFVIRHLSFCPPR